MFNEKNIFLNLLQLLQGAQHSDGPKIIGDDWNFIGKMKNADGSENKFKNLTKSGKNLSLNQSCYRYSRAGIQSKQNASWAFRKKLFPFDLPKKKWFWVGVYWNSLLRDAF